MIGLVADFFEDFLDQLPIKRVRKMEKDGHVFPRRDESRAEFK